MLCYWDGLLQSFQSTSWRSRACIPFMQEPIFPVEQQLRSTGHQQKHVLTAADASGTNITLVLSWKGSKPPVALQHRPAQFLYWRSCCAFAQCAGFFAEKKIQSSVEPGRIWWQPQNYQVSFVTLPKCTEREPVASYIPPCVRYVTSVVRPNKARCLGWGASYEYLTVLSYTGHRGDAFPYQRLYGSTTMVYHDNGKEC